MPLDSEEAADKSKLALENRRLREENRLLKYKLEVLIDMVRQMSDWRIMSTDVM